MPAIECFAQKIITGCSRLMQCVTYSGKGCLCAIFLTIFFVGGLQTTARAQATTNFRVPLVYGYQADPMMFTWNGSYYLYVNEQLQYNRLRRTHSLAGIASAADEIISSGVVGVGTATSCGYMLHWNSLWYQYCADGRGSLVLVSSADDPMSTYTLAGYIDGPSGFTGYSEWPIVVGSQIYMLFTNDATSTTLHSIWAAKFSNPYTRTGTWNIIATPNSGSGSWECGDSRCIDEGGSAVVHGSKAFLLFSAGGYESPDYCVGMLTASTSSDLTQQSSWTKSSGCVISRNNAASVYGPGSALWFKSLDGTQDWIVYHVKTSTNNQYNGDDRKLELMHITWDSGGNPIFASPHAMDTFTPLPSGDPGEMDTAPTISSWSNGILKVDAVGSGNNLYEDTWTGSTNTWSGWYQVGVSPPNGAALGPASISRTSNSIDMFVPTDSLIYKQTWNGTSWSSWTNMGGPNPSCCIGSVAGSRAATASWGSDRVDVFGLGLDHSLWQNTWTSETGYSGWTASLGYPSLGLPAGQEELMGAPAAVSREANAIDVFERDANGDIFTDSWNGTAWSGWSDVGAVSPGNASNPAVASWGSTNLQLYERGRDGNIYQNVWNGTSWAGWTSIGAPTAGAVSDPAAFSRTTNYADVFTRAADGNIYHTAWNGSSWSTWTNFGQP
jgi:GH43 family beta-xylosidase